MFTIKKNKTLVRQQSLNTDLNTGWSFDDTNTLLLILESGYEQGCSYSLKEFLSFRETQRNNVG